MVYSRGSLYKEMAIAQHKWDETNNPLMILEKKERKYKTFIIYLLQHGFSFASNGALTAEYLLNKMNALAEELKKINLKMLLTTSGIRKIKLNIGLKQLIDGIYLDVPHKSNGKTRLCTHSGFWRGTLCWRSRGNEITMMIKKCIIRATSRREVLEEYIMNMMDIKRTNQCHKADDNIIVRWSENWNDVKWSVQKVKWVSSGIITVLNNLMCWFF
ncbi:hypothetical protein F8M41_016774 [Gigaspora margarita]|uniref:Uncharacterized protein n=1 Tax=Gigaspora margarita TaxID=4874 RepID=A0A8H4EUP6_GIGMA|nr:hypothetical protein F8M41_016774 [Gigaspora margarita]